MAVTSIWHVSNRMDMALDYIMNPEKTTEKPELSPEAVAARQAVDDVINYASNADKTEQMMYVTGINCTPETALEDFMRTKRFWDKTDGRLAYHGYQSFREGDGEITAEKAHEIGIRLAQELWGDRFEVVVATHLNTGHYHNHFVVNSVSFMDGLKYRRTMDDYRKMREVSDRLCKEAKLHVVEEPSNIKGKNYSEWRAERQGKTTVRGTIREDIDYAIRLSRSEYDFVRTMEGLGYEFKFFKPDGTNYEHPGLKPPGAKSYFRFRGLGDGYDYESIRRRIIANTLVSGTPLLIESKSHWPNIEQVQGKDLPSTYKRYCIRLYALVSKPKHSKREYIPMALREDIAKLDQYIEQMDFLYQHRLDDKQSLQSMRANLQHDLNSLIFQRRKMYSAKKKLIQRNAGPLITQKTKEISDISRKIREVRKKLQMCDAVIDSTDRVVKNDTAPVKEPENRPSPQQPTKRYQIKR
ncbi:MAG: relaxase/mobilization nuclease domain-containing protein [Saccharofermentans sp.]|nr:relaxase/mobilization nuclease domain-containing protein [Saccharofermentans sp.]